MKNIEKYIQEIMKKKNNTPLAIFEGYSPSEMQYILYDFFNPDCVVQIKKLKEADYLKIPILNQIKFLLNLIKDKGELKLTNKGFLPVKVVASIYDQGFLTDFFIESGISKLYKEMDVPVVQLARIILELSPLVKKSRNKLSITKKGIKALKSNQLLFENIFKTFTTRFNWAYFDNYDNEEVGQLGYGFTLILLSKYGESLKNTTFYSKKYLNAFNFEQFQTDSSFPENLDSCYSIRSFKRFLDYFGLISYKSEHGYDVTQVKKTELFDKLIEIKPHKARKIKYEQLDNFTHNEDFFKNMKN